MRNLPILPIVALAGALQAASWKALPELPRGSAGTMTGDGNAVAFTGFLGGTSYHSPASSVAPWIKLRADLNTISVVVRGNQIAYLLADGVHRGVKYGALADSVLKTAVFTNTTGALSGIDQDGRRILAIRSGTNFTPTLHLSVDSVVEDQVFNKGLPPRTGHFWRRLFPPAGFTEYGDARGWIEGRLIVASNSSTTYLSRDTGATWSASPMPYLRDCDISGDTIVGQNYGSRRLYVSTDAGATWDSSALRGDVFLAFRGGRLYGMSLQSDTTYDLVSSTNLGRTWNTVLEEINSDGEFVAWDGSCLWARKRDALLRSRDEGRTWAIADSALGETVVGKIRGFGTNLLVSQRLTSPDTYGIPFQKLWAYDGMGWSLVRDSVLDFEVMDTDTGRAVFVLVDSGTRWSVGAYGLRLRLDRSFNLRAWQTMPGLSPYSVVLGLSPRGLLVGQKRNVAILTRGSRILLDTAWTGYERSLVSRGFLVEQDGELAWGDYRQMYRSVGTREELLGQGVKGYATLGSKYGYRITDTSVNWMADFTPMTVAYPLLKPTIASGVVVMRDSFATWNGTDTFALMRPEGRRLEVGPLGKGVTQVEYVSMNALGSLLAVVDSTYVVADLRGRLWRLDKYGSVGIAPSVPRSASLWSHRGVLALGLPVASRVRIERFDVGGSSLGVVVDGVLQPGRHEFRPARTSGVSFAVAIVDGIRHEAVRILPTGM